MLARETREIVRNRTAGVEIGIYSFYVLIDALELRPGYERRHVSRPATLCAAGFVKEGKDAQGAS